MSRHPHRNREFSATRPSYSRNRSVSAHQHSQLRGLDKSHNKSLLCNNCFNRQTVNDRHTYKKEQPKDFTSSFLQNEEVSKSRKIVEDRLKTVNEYNLNKIHEHEKKREAAKRTKREHLVEPDTSHQEDLQKAKKINEERRFKLREDLEQQITFAKERRLQKQEASSQQQKVMFEPNKAMLERREQLEAKYKQELEQQVKENRARKEQEKVRTARMNRLEGNQNELTFVNQDEEKRQAQKKVHFQNRENLKEEYKRREEVAVHRRTELTKERARGERSRLRDQEQGQAKIKEKEVQRKQNIDHYIQDLKEQMKVNSLNRKQQFERLHNGPIPRSIMAQSKYVVDNNKKQPCDSCSKTFPHQFLSPYQKGQS